MKDYYRKLGFEKLTEIQNRLLKLPKDRNILALSPCGSGKTEAAHERLLTWSKKAVFIQPMRTLATSIYTRLDEYHKTKLGTTIGWTIQHSTISNDINLDNNYSVTTIDQVLSGWLGFGRSAFIRGKNVVLSNLVFDEVQLFEPNKTLLTTLNMLDTLYKQGNKFMIMSATMPQYLIDFLKSRYDMDVVNCQNESIDNKKSIIQYVEKLDFEEINNRSEKQIIICNTQAQQEEIFHKIIDKSRCIVLNSKLTQADRDKAEADAIRYFGKKSLLNSKILIATQVVEAGIDISARYTYSASAPIDSLVQRAGRNVRWGGEGVFIVFKSDDRIYTLDNAGKDNRVVLNTIKEIKKHSGAVFSWELQKKLVNKVLNPIYKEMINKKSIKLNKIALARGSSNDLIRDIKNVSVIVSYTPTIDDFNKESVSIHIGSLVKLAKSNPLYIINENKELEKIDTFNENKISSGDTVIIKGFDCTYDLIGFRYKEGFRAPEFSVIKDISKKTYTNYNYVDEPWLYHANEVRRLVKENILKIQFSQYVVNNAEKIANALGLHDLGKLDDVWQGPKWANSGDTPLSHFKEKRYPGRLFENRKHEVISAYALEKQLDKVLFNVILNHHRKYRDEKIKITSFNINPKYNYILDNYGLTSSISMKGDTIEIDNNKLITPNQPEWNNFVYLVGLLKEVDGKSIENYVDSLNE